MEESSKNTDDILKNMTFEEEIKLTLYKIEELAADGYTKRAAVSILKDVLVSIKRHKGEVL